jgi:hypothetical protein
LVLPTIPSFCYGQGYPLQRVLEYFYGGVSTIVCSIDDPEIVEAARAKLPLIPGQEKLNNVFWFRLFPDQYATWKKAAEENDKGNLLSPKMLRQLENSIGQSGALLKTNSGSMAGPGSVSATSVHGHDRQSHRKVSAFSHHSRKSTMQGDTSPSRSESVLNRQQSFDRKSHKSIQSNSDRPDSARSTARPGTSTAQEGSDSDKRTTRGGGSWRVSNREQTVALARAKAKPGKKLHHARLGALLPDDPFFWFCAQNFALYTYPADCIPKHFLKDDSVIHYCYNDVVSRTGTPEIVPTSQAALAQRQSLFGGNDEENDDALEHDDDGSRLQNNSLVPPSICLCQPTEIAANPRHRWEVRLEFVDKWSLILGDSGWFPGALGQRFSFEAKAENVDQFLRVSEVPQGQLLYMEHKKLSRADLKEKAKTDAGPHDDLWESGSSSSSEDSSHSSDASGRPSSRGDKRAAKQRQRFKAQSKKSASKGAADHASLKGGGLMLMPSRLDIATSFIG